MAGCISMGACAACLGLCLNNHYDFDRHVGCIWGEDGELGAMGDLDGVVCAMFWGRFFSGVDGFIFWAGVQNADKIRSGTVNRIDG